ncbi:DMT family transporter [Helicovermis profundi]|uniref:DMT family transporter n=1 Tax=Helicovermis profundi TaxID=3065157 RepID=A0AAU9EQ09_9FIRM|nr:DMT family transporter [Clostridia bacterium S502]
MNKNRIKGNILLFITSIIWGLAFVAQRLGGEVIGAYSFNGIRFFLGALSLIPLIIYFDKKNNNLAFSGIKKIIPSGILLGFILFIASALQQIGIMYTSVGNTAFITGLYIVLVPLIGILFRHKATKQTWISSVIAMIGLYFLSISKGFSINYGDLLELIGAFFWATHILSIDYFVKKYDALKLSMIQFFSCSIFSAVSAILFENTTTTMIYNAFIPILYGGLMSVGVAYTLQVVGQKYAKPSHAALILSLETVFGAIGAAIILSEKLTTRGYFGASLMFVGMIFSQIKLKNTK